MRGARILIFALLGTVLVGSAARIGAQGVPPGGKTGDQASTVRFEAGEVGATPPETGLRPLAQLSTKFAPSRKKVLILIAQKARHIDLVAALRGRIERTGGRVRAVFGLAGILADIELSSGAALAATKGVQGIYDRTIAAARPSDPQTLAVVAAWNRIAGTSPATTLATKRPFAGPSPDAPATDVLEAPDLPRDALQLRKMESQYRRHQALQRNLPPQLRRSGGQGCGTNGAGYMDTSLYFAGDIAVGVGYVNGSSGGWTQTGSASTASTANTFAEIISSLDKFIDFQPDARLVFTYVNEVDGTGNPLPAPPNERTYVNDLRNTYCTDWAYLILVQNGGLEGGNAYLHGPSTRIGRTYAVFAGDFDYVVRHETCHIFGAGDQYDPAGPTARYGYLMAAHANACGNDGSGFFSGGGECLDDLMAGWTPNLGYNSIIGPYTAGQLGWQDSDGDGKLDVTQTTPVIDPASVVHGIGSSSDVTYRGVAFDRPLLNELQPFFYGNVSINSITEVQYRINTAAWQDAAAGDGVFDSVSEVFMFTTPKLRNGTYTMQIRAINTVGTVTTLPYTEQITITGSIQTNTRPFGSLTLTPERAKFGTLINASGGASSDLEPGLLQYSWKWGTLPWTAFSPGFNATHVFVTPGTYTVQMRVRDLGGLIHVVPPRSVTIEATDTPPEIALTVRPENQHFTLSPIYSLSLTVAGSRDAETAYAQLKVEWDIDCDGWDGPPSLIGKTRTALLINSHYPKSDRRCIRARVSDPANNAAQTERFIWVVPYNHQPSVSGVTFTPAGPDYTATVNATDPDTAAWDAMLEYRYDFEGDGIWDTKFDPTPIISLLAAYRNSVAVGAKDRFHGRAVWFNSSDCSGFPLICR